MKPNKERRSSRDMVKRISVLMVLSLLILLGGFLFIRENSSIDARSLVYETKTPYSHVKVVDREGLRFLYFVRANGEEVVESAMDLTKPQSLILEYTQIMFASFLIRPEQKDCLLVGLGAGSMVNFAQSFFPALRLDVVEIDAGIIEIARTYFALKSNGLTSIIEADGYEFILGGQARYDVIYMDAFLKPSQLTDSTGAPRKMKQADFYETIKRRLKADGLLVININNNHETAADIDTIRKSFPQVYVFVGKSTGNLIAIGSTNAHRVSQQEMLASGRQLDAKGVYGFSFEKMAAYLQ